MADSFDVFTAPTLVLKRLLPELRKVTAAIDDASRPWLATVPPAKSGPFEEPATHPDDPANDALGVPFAPAPEGRLAYWPIRSTHDLGRTVSYYDAEGKAHGGTAGRCFGGRRGGGRNHVAVDLYGRHHDVVVACEDGTVIGYFRFYRGVWCCLVDHGDYVINYGEIEGDTRCRRTRTEEIVERAGTERESKWTRHACPGGTCNSSCKKGGHANAYVRHQRADRVKVKKGETLADFAARHSVSVDDLRRINPTVVLEDGDISKHKRLWLPTTPFLGPGSKVRAGDVLGEIGRMGSDSMLHFEMYAKDVRTTFRWDKGATLIHDAITANRKGKTHDPSDRPPTIGAGASALRIADRRDGTKLYAEYAKTVGKRPPREVYLDPTRYLLHLAQHGR